VAKVAAVAVERVILGPVVAAKVALGAAAVSRAVELSLSGLKIFLGKTSVPVGGSSASGKSSATAYGSGGGQSLTIPTGQLFAGRSAGGASRSQVYGTRFANTFM
jgi:hypothetical protein